MHEAPTESLVVVPSAYGTQHSYTNSTWVTLTSPASLLYQGGSSSQPPRYRPKVAQMQGSTSPEGEPQQPQPPLKAEPRRNPTIIVDHPDLAQVLTIQNKLLNTRHPWSKRSL